MRLDLFPTLTKNSNWSIGIITSYRFYNLKSNVEFVPPVLYIEGDFTWRVKKVDVTGNNQWLPRDNWMKECFWLVMYKSL